ncbi:STAS domain-containing protein [Mycolicibacterium hodleri]|uniref:Anti-sigma factor antagonist n=1 Tax=Mycolicibacterium hodleri TaxID=49897 RepID=A0A502DV35_9MYCO|nr:STAS domain-containing protein [Mycolicibacterium hodleri]TPG28086.1 anti-sigma factor antagonist [Mycolicibacterium hodleri]
MTTPLTLTSSHRDDGTPTLHVTGEIDLDNVDAFTTALHDTLTHASPHTTITVDLGAVTYLDSAAINTLFTHADHVQIIANPLLMAALTITGLTDLITITPTTAND